MALREFKYACPVCGQHMMCDSSQGGSVMECPTCFQKIIAPQAPATDDPKFILTGTKAGERHVSTIPGINPVAPVKTFPGTAVVVIILLCIGAAAAFVYSGTIFHHSTEQLGADNSASQKVAPANLPSASDSNWLLNLKDVAIPDVAATGRVHGESSTLDRAALQSGTLTLRPSVHGSPDVSVAINFSGAQADALAGQSINVTTNTEQAARVTLRWKNGAQSAKENFDKGYALRLEFGEVADNQLPGKIYLVTPDMDKSYVAGTFNAEIRKPKPSKKKA